MANGDITVRDRGFLHAVLLDALGATSDGAWIDLGANRRDVAVYVDGITTATVTINGSSATTKPADSANGDPIGSNITADGHFAVAVGPRWIKARITAWTSGTISVFLTASGPG